MEVAKGLSSMPEAVEKSRLLFTANGSHLVDLHRLVLSTKAGLAVVRCKDILRCEVDGTGSAFHLVDGNVLHSIKGLKFYERKLREWNFIKVHKSNMVNLRHVEGYVKGKGGSLILSDNTMVPVAVRKKPRLMKVFSISN